MSAAKKTSPTERPDALDTADEMVRSARRTILLGYGVAKDDPAMFRARLLDALVELEFALRCDQHGPAGRSGGAVSDAVLVAAQQTRTIATLQAWAEKRPGRSFTVQFIDGRWRATLSDMIEAGGSTVTDALAQIATYAALEHEEVTP